MVEFHKNSIVIRLIIQDKSSEGTDNHIYIKLKKEKKRVTT